MFYRKSDATRKAEYDRIKAQDDEIVRKKNIEILRSRTRRDKQEERERVDAAQRDRYKQFIQEFHDRWENEVEPLKQQIEELKRQNSSKEEIALITAEMRLKRDEIKNKYGPYISDLRDIGPGQAVMEFNYDSPNFQQFIRDHPQGGRKKHKSRRRKKRCKKRNYFRSS
jgi:hypothetical protein